MMAPLADFARRYGPWAVVTGASEGIGRACAERLAGCGINLVLVARRAILLDALCLQLGAHHGISCRPLALDLARPDAASQLAAATRELDVGLLVAAAGFGRAGPVLTADDDCERDMLRVNCEAVLGQCLQFGRRFAQRRRGGLVLFSSVLAFSGAPGAANYAATKAYVQTLAEGLQLELAPAGVDVVYAAPGPVHTGFAARAGMTMRAAMTPEVIARDTLAALGRRGFVRPGGLSKLLGWSLATAPRALRMRIVQRVVRSMTAPAHTRGQHA